VAKRKKSSARRIPKARVVPRFRRVDVTRGEYNRIVDLLNERGVILNGLVDAVNDLRNTTAIQFKRTAQLQAELDDLKARDRRSKTLA
jgi:hypothetical protein